MGEARDVVITVDKIHLQKILSGQKHIEIRKRWTTGTVGVVWFCEKGSGGRIVGQAAVEKVEYLDVNEGWHEHGKQTGVTRDIYFQYIGEHSKVYYIFLKSVFSVEGMVIKNLGINSAPQNFAFVRI